MKSIRFDNRVLKRLPIDSEKQNFVREVKNACFSLLKPTPVVNPTLVAASPSALALLGLPYAIAYQIAEPTSASGAGGSSPTAAASQNNKSSGGGGGADINADLVSELRNDVTRFLSGNELMEGSETASHCYCGHQFGSFAGQLGDGAAIYLGEVLTPEGIRAVDAANSGNRSAAALAAQQVPPHQQRWELQLKGAGLTPYSRTADGRKVLRSSLREFVASEYMAAAGVPTTRAASLITSDSRVARDPIYTGAVVMERCSIVSRIAETFIRFGSFEICKPQDDATSRAGPSVGNTDVIKALYTYVAEEFYSEIANACKKELAGELEVEAKAKKNAQISSAVARLHGEAPPADAATTALPLSNGGNTISWEELASTRIMAEICKRTASLVAKWQALGWVHGVLNTDNMSIVGLTIDYGPYGFMTHFDNDHVPNLSDHGGRYSYRQQPAMCQWNLGKLAEAWALIFPKQKAAYDEIIKEHYGARYNEEYKMAMAAKLGVDYAALLETAIHGGDTTSTENDNDDTAATSEKKTTAEIGAEEEARVERASFVEDTVMELIGELMFALQMSGAEMTNTFDLLKKATIVASTSSKNSNADSLTTNSTSISMAALAEADATRKAAQEALDTELATKIADLCITPSARQRIIKRRISHLKTNMHPQQIEQLLQIAKIDPDRLRDIFSGNVEPEQIILFLTEEQKKAQDSQRLQAEFMELVGLPEEAKHAKDVTRWKSFIVEYRKALEALGVTEGSRKALMAKTNPVFVPFPWVLQDAIAQAEDGQYSLVRNLVERCAKPFEDDPRDGVLWKMIPPPQAEEICVSCSS